MNQALNKIEITNLHKAFGQKKVLCGIDLQVKQGQSLVVIGGSGSGKSVLLKNILGLVPPDSGTIKIDGVANDSLNASERDQFMAKFGMLFQGGALFDSLTVWENITFAVRRRDKLSKSQAHELAIQKLKQVGLTPEVASQRPSELSGGMQKRVALARAICGNPEIIFFDEPTTGLDPIMAEVINELIVECCKKIGATAITITHDMHSAKIIADEIAMLYKGQIIWRGEANQIMQSGNAFVEQFVHGKSEGPIAF
jgi:phospholipid/cholesterol/gamma-HCH transport system ATP-binding protein